MAVKSIFHSKTLAVNTVALGVALYQYYVAPITSADPQVFALAVALINIALRFKTSVPVSL
jgi:hypothetical protein